MSPPSVALLVLNYNGRQLTLESIDSLSRMTYPAFEIFHVDNGSTDGSGEAVGAAFPAVRQVRLERNVGPVAGINLGFRAGIEAGHPYQLLLNNDIEVDPEMLTELVRVAEGDARIGAVGPKIYYHGEPTRLWCAGGEVVFGESPTREHGMGELDRGQFDNDREVGYLTGCALLTRAEVVARVGDWDPAFQFAGEDADWCLRLRAEGYRCLYAHRAVMWHKVGRTAGSYSTGRSFYTGRSAALLARRHAGPVRWLSFALRMSAAIPLAFLRELPRRNQMAAVRKLQGAWEGLRLPLEAPPRGAGAKQRGAPRS